MEHAYNLTRRVFLWSQPLLQKLGRQRAERVITPLEELGKRMFFDCRMCGQCILHSTGMTCPMTCPKNLRNGPCGGVRSNGHCEVQPEMPCVWVLAYERSMHMSIHGQKLQLVQPPLNRQLEGSSAWINMLTGRDQEVPKGWGVMAET